MNVAGLADPAGAGSTDRWGRSSNMDQLILRENRDMRNFDEDGSTVAGWQGRRPRVDTGTYGNGCNKKDVGITNRIIGVAYVGALVVFMLVYLT